MPVSEGWIWDIFVPETRNYLYGGGFSHNSDIDGYWLDEEIVDEDWVPEMSARVLDRRGRGIWSATPQSGTEQLYELHDRAMRSEEDDDPAVAEFLILLANNPHFSDKAKREFAASLSPEELAVRIGGEFAINSYKVYPEFSMTLHGVDYFPIPKDWTRYMIVDPGHQVCAVLFAAVPPANVGDFVYLYDELYLKECDANKFATRVAAKAEGQTFHAFIMDAHMGVHTEMGIGLTVAQQYAEALRSKGVRSLTTGNNFTWGSDDVEAGILSVHGLMRVREDGTTKLRVLRGAMQSFQWEIERYHNKREKGMVTDKPNQKKNNHLMDAIRYLAMYSPRYVLPKEVKSKPTGAILVYRDRLKRRKEQEGGSTIRLGPGRR